MTHLVDTKEELMDMEICMIHLEASSKLEKWKYL